MEIHFLVIHLTLACTTLPTKATVSTELGATLIIDVE